MHRLQKQNYTTVWKKKIDKWDVPASLKMFHTTLKQVVTMNNVNLNCMKESAKLPLKNVTQIIKNNAVKKKERYKFIYWLLEASKLESSSKDFLECEMEE